MKKTFKSYFAIWAILLGLFNIIAFVFGGLANPVKYTPSFWIGYVFITLAFVGQFICAKVAFNAKSLQKLFYNISLISLSWIGLIVSFIAGGLCMIISPLPYWVGVIVCAIILAITAIAVLKADVAAVAVSDIDDKIKVQTFFIKSLTLDAEGLLASAQTAEIKNECKKVFEAVRYSDPMSNDALTSIDSQITTKFAKLSEAVAKDDIELTHAIADELIILLGNRNNRCKLLK